jgi:hypothetical protein
MRGERIKGDLFEWEGEDGSFVNNFKASAMG